MRATEGVLAFRFDVDSVICIERGIPALRRLADRLGVRFSFFVNMGHSFNWAHNARHLVRRSWTGARPAPRVDGARRSSLPARSKLGWRGVLKTVLLNPALGERYRATFDALHDEGHELGLHGGMDHAVWQRSLDELAPEELERLFRPAYTRFCERYGRPAGFASPGFRYNEAVLSLLDSEGFTYASDMSGESPFRPSRSTGDLHDHFQVPVNVLGQGRVPLVEQGLALGRSVEEIEQDLIDAIRPRPFALAYGHPYVEGVHAPLLERVVGRLRDEYRVVTVAEYLEQWRARHG